MGDDVAIIWGIGGINVGGNVLRVIVTAEADVLFYKYCWLRILKGKGYVAEGIKLSINRRFDKAGK